LVGQYNIGDIMNIKGKLLFGLMTLILLSSMFVSAKTVTINSISDANVDGVKIGVQTGTTSDLYGEDDCPMQISWVLTPFF